MKHYTFNLDEKDINIIDDVADRMTCPNRSEAIRKILREWRFWAKFRLEHERKMERSQNKLYDARWSSG